jgi:hypothetical protein
MMKKGNHTKDGNLFGRLLLLVTVFLTFNFAAHSQNADTMLFQYFNRTISQVMKDSSDTLKLRQLIFELVVNKIVANDYQDVVAIFGTPIHTHVENDGSRYLIYPLAYIQPQGYGSMLLTLRIAKDLSIIKGGGFIYFLETNEDFLYWHGNPPTESKEGDANCPPLFRN